MPNVNKDKNQATLDALRKIRRKLYSISESDLNAMGLEDQAKYGEELHQTGLAILHLETAKLKGVNDKFKKKETQLKTAAASLEKDLSNLEEAVQIIRAACDTLVLISNITKLLGFV